MKAQLSEFISIIVLVMIIVVFVMLNRLSSSSAIVGQGESAMQEYKRTYTGLTSIIFPAITINGTPIGEILGISTCYNTAIVDFGLGEINLTKEVKLKLDGLLGKDAWLLQIDQRCFSSNGLAQEKCSPSESMSVVDIFYPLPCQQKSAEGRLFVKS